MRGPKQLARGLIERTLDLADERRRLDERTSPATKIAQRSLFLEYRRLAAEGGRVPSVWDTGYRVFSQFDVKMAHRPTGEITAFGTYQK